MAGENSFALTKIIRNGVEYVVSGGFRNVSDCVYKDGKLISFTADGKQYELGYDGNKLSKVTEGNKSYTISYKNNRLVGISEDS